MKKTMMYLAASCALVVSNTVYATDTGREIENIAFTKYRILSQGPALLQGNATYVITTNPPMAIAVGTKGPAVVELVSRGHIEKCTKLSPDDYANMKILAPFLMGRVGQLNMVVSMGGQLTKEQSERLEGWTNYVNFANEAVDLPNYECPAPPL